MTNRKRVGRNYKERLAEVQTEYAAMAGGYDEGSREAEWSGPAQIANALSGFISPGMHVLDAGTGTGEAMQRLRAVQVSKPLHITGLDLSKDMLKVAAGKGVADKLHRQDLAQRWQVEGSSQDAIMSSGVMEYLDDQQARGFIRQAARALKPDGKIAITFRPDGGDVSTEQKLHSVERVRQLFEENGITPRSIEEFTAYRYKDNSGVIKHVLMTGIKQENAVRPNCIPKKTGHDFKR